VVLSKRRKAHGTCAKKTLPFGLPAAGEKGGAAFRSLSYEEGKREKRKERSTKWQGKTGKQQSALNLLKVAP